MKKTIIKLSTPILATEMLFKVIVILAALFLMTSCSNSDKEEYDKATDDSEHIHESVFETYYDMNAPIAEPYVETEYSAFNNSNSVIIEWGEALELKDGEGNDIVLKDKSYGKTYVCYPVKYMHLFKSTLHPEIESCFSEEFKSDLYYILKPSFEMLKNYDDVVAVCSETDDLIEKGRTDLVHIEDYKTFYFPYYGNDENLELTPYCFGFDDAPNVTLSIISNCQHLDEYAKLYRDDIHTIRLIKIKDGKVDLDGSYEGDPQIYIPEALKSFEYTNERLIKLGYKDKIFRDGMTIDELEEYFELVTNHRTFDPLFDN